MTRSFPLRGVNSPSAHSPPPPGSAGPSTRLRAGFTILEILIAIVILVVGITGIVALFPTAIESGNKTVEDSYAAAITQSVIDAISVGLRESKYTVQAGGPDNRLYTYFIFDHDGVLDKASGTPQTYSTASLWKQDFTILLPKGPPNNKLSKDEPIFTYPVVTDDAAPGIGVLPGPKDKRAPGDINGFSAVGAAVDDFDTTKFFKIAADGSSQPWIRRTYPLGRYRDANSGIPNPPNSWRYAIRQEFLGPVFPAGATDEPLNRPVVDPYPQYSFAIAITRAKIDNCDTSGTPVPDGKITKEDMYSDNLYEVRIMIFRNFDASVERHSGINGGGKIPRCNLPVREFVTLMSI